MDLELKDKVAIVGGASKGLGRACAQVLAEEGVRVAVCSRSRDDLEKAAQEIRGATGRDVFAFPGDLDRHETITELIAARSSASAASTSWSTTPVGRRWPGLTTPPRSSGRSRSSDHCCSSRGCRGRRCRI